MAFDNFTFEHNDMLVEVVDAGEKRVELSQPRPNSPPGSANVAYVREFRAKRADGREVTWSMESRLLLLYPDVQFVVAESIRAAFDAT